MNTRWMILVVAGCLVAGCSSGGAKSSADAGPVKLDVAVAAVPSGWVQVEDATLGLKIQLPQGWERVDNSPASQQRVQAAVRQAFPSQDSSAYVASFGQASTLELMDLNVGRMQAGNLRTLHADVLPLQTDWNLADAKKQAQEGRGPSGFQMTGTLETPIGKMVVFRAVDTSENLRTGRPSQQVMHLFAFGEGRARWAMTFGYPIEVEAEMKPVVEQIMRSVRVSRPNLDAIRAKQQSVAKEQQAARDQSNAAAARDAQRDPAREHAIEQERLRQIAEARQVEMDRFNAEQARLQQQQQQQQQMHDQQMQPQQHHQVPPPPVHGGTGQ